MHEQAIKVLRNEIELLECGIRGCDKRLEVNPLNVVANSDRTRYQSKQDEMLEAIKVLESKVKWDAYYESMGGEYE